MMKKLKSLTKKKKTPLYYKKSKAAKEEEEYNEIDETEDLPKRKPQKQSPSRRKKSSRYNREYEYSEDEDDYGYEKQMYDSGEEMSEYMTEDTSKYRRYPRRTREYQRPNRTETEDFDDSDSDCRTCTSRRKPRSDYTSEYPSEYQLEDIPSQRHRNMRRQSFRKRKLEPSETEIERRRRVPSETEFERSPHRPNIKNKSSNRRYYHHEYEEAFDSPDPYGDYYESNYRENPYQRMSQEVYVARGPVGHKAFTVKQQQELREQTSASGSDMDFDDNDDDDDDDGQEREMKEPAWRTNPSRYEVYAANTGENQGVFQKQSNQNPREKLLSVTEYDNSIPMIALKNTSTSKSQDESQLVYLPVVVMDNTIKLPHSKVVRAESILRTIGDKAEKPLETNMNIYLATEADQGNIFQQAQRNIDMQDITTTPTNLQVYTAQSAHSTPVDKKPSMISKIGSMVKTKNKNKSDYPVQKSYINVVPSNTKRVEKKGSKLSIKSGGSKTSGSTTSLVGEDKPNSPKGSSYYANVHKKDKKNKRKLKLEESDSAIISIVNPTGKHTDEQRTNTVITTERDMHKQKSTQRSASASRKNKATGDGKSALTKQSTFDRNISLLKPLSLDKSSVKESTVKNEPSKSSLLERQCSTERKKDSKIITIKDVTNGQFEESKNIFEQSEPDLQSQKVDSEAAQTKKKGFGGFFHKKDSKAKLDQTQDFTPQYAPPNNFNKDQHDPSTSSTAAVQRHKSKEDGNKPKKSASGRKLKKKRSNVEFSNKNEEFQFWKVLSFDSHAFAYVFQVVQYFLGLSIHGTLMEILRNSKQND